MCVQTSSCLKSLHGRRSHQTHIRLVPTVVTDLYKSLINIQSSVSQISNQWNAYYRRSESHTYKNEKVFNVPMAIQVDGLD